MTTNYAGIDYGMGSANVDTETGIRYGVISCHSLGEGFYDAQEMDYGDPTCPKCGNTAAIVPSHTESSNPPGEWVSVIQDIPEAWEDYETAEHECSDYACEHCQYLFGSESAFSDEPRGWSIDDGEYKVIDCLDNDAMVIKSPYFTYAQFCSPCVPGAGNLDNPMNQGEGCKAYCFGPDWFDNYNPLPYPVYSVETGELVCGMGATTTESEDE